MQLAKNRSVTCAVYLRVAWVIVTPYGSFIVFLQTVLEVKISCSLLQPVTISKDLL